MARSSDRGRVLFTCSLPMSVAIKIYDFADELEVGANKIIQALCEYASERAYVGVKSNNVAAVMFKENGINDVEA